MPKHIQPDQEPTPIDCQIFKERVTFQLLTSQLPGLPRRVSSERGALYRRFLQRQPLSRLSSEPLNQPQKPCNPLFLNPFSPCVSSERGALYRRFLRRQHFFRIFLSEPPLQPQKTHNPLFLNLFPPSLSSEGANYTGQNRSVNTFTTNFFEPFQKYTISLCLKRITQFLPGQTFSSQPARRCRSAPKIRGFCRQPSRHRPSPPLARPCVAPRKYWRSVLIA